MALQQMAQEKGEKLSFREEQIQFSGGRRGVTITLPMENTEDIYGFGLQLFGTNYAGRKRYIRVNSSYKYGLTKQERLCTIILRRLHKIKLKKIKL